jgi:hypothetical protein
MQLQEFSVLISVTKETKVGLVVGGGKMAEYTI